MLSRNSGIRDIQEVLQVSRICILNHLLKEASLCQWTPKQTRYKSLQIDEHSSYVGSKKRKRWLIYAYAPEKDVILAYVIGSRSAKTVRKLYQMLVKLQIDEYCTVDWKSFKEVFAKENHKKGKSFTRNIEGINNALRARIDVLSEKLLVFQKRISITKLKS
jgi:Transposase and inactivated derivatives, IS1 family